MHRIPFDSNDQDEERRFELKFEHCLQAIAACDPPLKVGDRIVIYMDDLEGEATLEWNERNAEFYGHGWVARADETKWRDI